ncbi:MAG: diguanylate cyclase [Clostridiales bacterium]|nr:diguanylate cyclase [Clostridiales bacterium]
MTGLYNRAYLEDNRDRINTEQNLPLSVIFADINGLKMTNDIFGHSAGDKLIQETAQILMGACRGDDIVVRVGGDECVILMPNTEREGAKQAISRIKGGFLDAKVEAVRCSVSLGSDTKINGEESFEQIMINAENIMYRDKAMNRGSIDRDIIKTIVETLHIKNPRQREHSIRVKRISKRLVLALGLSAQELDKLERASYLHDK